MKDTHVWPAGPYSKTGSQPKAMVPLAGTIFPWEYISYIYCLNGETNTYFCASLEDNWLVARPFRVCKCAHGLGGFILEVGEHLVQAIVTEGLEEPFAISIESG
jgi:hypothetical protein